MKQYIQTVLNSKGISLSEKEYEIISEVWQGIEQLRSSVEEKRLDDFNMELFLIPKGEMNNE
ncbi:hypothetical protein [Domibacillus epiphyticus]|uniref:Uncharacterized protein n=1 Tax=Domibacillus epiphyticus TaxID=1714355 RepID=A0A1V2ACM9_9BACI|nr:hypothetical protein [Domibacillus epiphyticus]OMP68739.1 hypothetical protein BTO28_01445 [Domibacillus epiphyticus]